MRVKRSIVSLFICFAICFSFLPVNVFAAGISGEGWNLTDEGVLHITGAVPDAGFRLSGEQCLLVKSVVAEPGASISSGFTLFAGFKNMTTADLSNLDTSGVSNMTSMFYNCSSLTTLDLRSFDTRNVNTLSNMFSGCSNLKSVDLSSFVTSKVTMTANMFMGCTSLESLDLRNFDTSKVYTMIYMFSNCSSLTSLDVSSFNTSNVKAMYDMFFNCSSLTTLNVSSFNTGLVTDMNSMFQGCSGLTSLDLSGFNTGSVTDLNNMFNGCSSLTSINISNFDTGSVTSMANMFLDCRSLTYVDVSGFNTENVKNASFMFKGCESLTSVDISNFDTTRMTNISNMFSECWALSSVGISPALLSPNAYELVAISSVWYNKDTGEKYESFNALRAIRDKVTLVKEPLVLYGVWVNGEQFTSYKSTIDCGTGTAIYDPDTNVLTLDGAQITDANNTACIVANGALTINVVNDCSIIVDSEKRLNGIFTDGNLNIIGTGNLAISVMCGGYDGIEANGNVTVSDSVNLDIVSAAFGINIVDGNLKFNGSGDVSVGGSYGGVIFWGEDSQMLLNGTNESISIHANLGFSAIFNGDTDESPVYGTNVDTFTVTGSPDSNSVTYRLKTEEPETGVAGFCERLYTCCLGRASEPEGKAYWIESLHNGATGADAAHAFFFCPEFIDGNYSNEEYVTRLYTTFMDRVPSDGELSYWADLITSGSMTRESVFWGFVGSPEWIGICESYGILPGTVPTPTDPVEPDSVEAFATRLYTTCLGRDGEEAGIAYWSDALRSGNATGRAAAHTFFFSDEFVGDGHTDSEFVARLYRTFMGREGSEAEIAYWVSNVDAYGRESVFDGFATSDEFADLCNAAGINP